MLIIALVLALIGLVALVFAVVTSNELVAWMCIVASVLGVVLLIIDAFRERQRRDTGDDEDGEGRDSGDDEAGYVDYPEDVPGEGEPDADTGDTAIDESSEEAGTGATEESAVSADRRSDDGAR
jgi:hypothetical protein